MFHFLLPKTEEQFLPMVEKRAHGVAIMAKSAKIEILSFAVKNRTHDDNGQKSRYLSSKKSQCLIYLLEVTIILQCQQEKHWHL